MCAKRAERVESRERKRERKGGRRRDREGGRDQDTETRDRGRVGRYRSTDRQRRDTPRRERERETGTERDGDRERGVSVNWQSQPATRRFAQREQPLRPSPSPTSATHPPSHVYGAGYHPGCDSVDEKVLQRTIAGERQTVLRTHCVCVCAQHTGHTPPTARVRKHTHAHMHTKSPSVKQVSE